MRPSAVRLARRAVALGAVTAGALLVGSTLTATEGCADKAPAPSAAAPIVIGVSLGLTGDLDTFAAPLRDAVRTAEGQINAGGGLLGRPVRFDVRDDKSDEGAIVTGVANDLVRDGVVA